MPGELARIDIRDERHLRLREPVEQCTGRAPIRRHTRELTHDHAGDARAIRFDVFRIDPVIADHRRGHHHDLAEVGRIGEDFLIAAQVRGENDFSVGLLERQWRGSGEPGAVL